MSTVADLLSRRRTTISIGDAPDGLPWRLHIDRGPSADDLLAPIAARLGFDPRVPHRGEAFDDLTARLNSLLDQRDVQRIDTGEATVDCYVTASPIARIVGPSLLARLLNRSSATCPIPLAQDTRNFRAEGSATVPGPPRPTPPFPPVAPPFVPGPSGIGSGRLALPLDGSPMLVVSRVTQFGGPPTYRYLRPFESEWLPAFAGARFEVRPQPPEDTASGSLEDTLAYQRARRQLVRGGQYQMITCSVDRADVVERAAEAADALYRLHQSGQVHADVKPSNILVTRTGARVIDSLAVPPGDKSPAMTPGWAAPEQIIGNGVAYTTDQYALGLLLCELLEAVRYGEEATFIVPVGGRQTERFTLLRNPGVYLAPEHASVESSGIERWHRLVSRCLRFRPEERFPTMADLAAELRDVAEAYPLTGQLEMIPYFGILEADSDDRLGWQVDDVQL